MTDEQAVVHIEWHPLGTDDALGSVTLERQDGTQEDHGHLTKADTARLAARIYGGSATRISAGGGVVRWVERGSG